MIKSLLFRSAFIVLGFVLIQSCSELPNFVAGNQPPHTYLTLFPDSTISPHSTSIKISWWGDDPDGFVAGFYISFDSLNWTFTTKNDSTFQLNIHGQDSTFHFWVAAVDNKGLRDPHPASNRYPVYNSAPSVVFDQSAKTPDTSFTVATFVWSGTDPDGNNTIRYYYWALNDTSNWHRVPSSTTTITLRQDSGIVPNANNRLFLKAQDIAGAYSTVAKMPDSSRTWYVRAPVGRILFVNDYPRTAPTDVRGAVDFYTQVFDTMHYSTLDIKVNSGGNIPKVRNPMFIETMKLFQCVVWVGWRAPSGLDAANLDLAQQTIPYYLLAGGKVFFSTGFQTNLSSFDLANFASVDSIASYDFGLVYAPFSVNVSDNNYDTLSLGTTDPYTFTNVDNPRVLYPNSFAHPIYTMINPNNPSQSGVCCLKNSASNPNIVFMSLPLHRMNEGGHAANFLNRVLHVDFGLN